MHFALRTAVSLLLLCVPVAAQNPGHRLSEIVAILPEWKRVSEDIIIPKIDFRDVPWSEILPELERLSQQHDPTKKGIRIAVPERFKLAFAKVADSRFNAQLGPHISIGSVLTEIPPPGWFYVPLSAREVAVVPESAVINDLSK